MVGQPLRVIRAAGATERQPGRLSWRLVSASPQPVSFVHGKVVMESLGKDDRGACSWGLTRTFPTCHEYLGRGGGVGGDPGFAPPRHLE